MTTPIMTLAELIPRAADMDESHERGVIAADGTITNYRALERMTRAVAQTLDELGVSRHDRVGVLCPKSLESFVAMHAVLRAGAVAVPLDPFGAQQALRSTLEQVAPAAIIGETATVARLIGEYLHEQPVPLVAIGDLSILRSMGLPDDLVVGWSGVAATASSAPLPVVDVEDPAYIIFTSGSTGVSKGIVHTHRSGLAYAVRAVDHHELRASSRLAGTTALHFDMSTLELYAVPLAGATAVTITEAEQRFPASLSSHVERDSVTHLYAVPFLLRQLTDLGVLEQRDLAQLSHIAYGGEPYAPAEIVALRALLSETAMLNVYGPAEVNAVTTYRFTAIEATEEAVPIGRPWANVDVRIVDDEGVDVETGQTGELLISAATCMQGYWRQPDLTQSRFIERGVLPPWYASGDLVYEREDGNLMFVGRKDNQVKIRGVRVELEATEAVLAAAPGIAQAVVGKIDTDAGSGLVAWIVLESNVAFDVRDLRSWCRTRLPGPAIPTRVVEIERVPTTASGKVDRKRLEADATDTATSGEYR